MKNCIVTCIVCVLTFLGTTSAQQVSELQKPTVTQASSSDDQDMEDENEIFLDRQSRVADIHRTFAFTTAGLILVSDALGLYHFLNMLNRGHQFRDSIGFSEENPDVSIQEDEIQRIWNTSESQTIRVLHGSSIAASMIMYTATATMELAMPRMDRSTSKFSGPNMHQKIFFVHAALMVVNVGLGFAESYALSRGNHNLVQGFGIAHMAIGFSIPVIMVSAGLAFNFGQ